MLCITCDLQVIIMISLINDHDTDDGDGDVDNLNKDFCTPPERNSVVPKMKTML